MFGSSQLTHFQHVAEGTWGEFASPAGRVMFLMTKARLGKNQADNESRLTAQLSPVREVLDIKNMNFNQLLQRDLDDHRVAVSLLPYLIKPALTGPAFFPPIMAAMLPFDSATPTDEFPAVSHRGAEADPSFGGTPFNVWQYGTSFRFQQMAEPDGSLHRVRFGRISWNSEHAKLVVLDGQHRAMALIAVDRTINGTWQASSGNRYKHFYEHRVKDLLQEAKFKGLDVRLDAVEFPVTICWFPDYQGHGADRSPHTAARKLFVDVNKNARAPSEARLILLSDTELVNIFTRNLLNEMRTNGCSIPLYAIEYDAPDSEASRPPRWSVIANLTMLRNATLRCVFGPETYLTNMGELFGGRPNWFNMNKFMHKQLQVKELFPKKIEDGERIIERHDLTNDHFPIYNAEALKKLENQFAGTWGAAILNVLGGLLPYKRHIEAVEELERIWLTDDAVGSLAREALFEGVGLYWTLRDSYKYWLEREQNDPKHSNQKPEIVKAWQALEGKSKDFEVLRAAHYLGKSTKEAVQQSESLYKITNTHACLIGALLTVGTLAHYHPSIPVKHLSKNLVDAWNAALASGPTKNRNRTLIFCRDIPHPLNQIAKMDTPLAVYFRYFWLELLNTPQAQEALDIGIDRDILQKLTGAARRPYFDYLVNEKDKALRKTEPTWSEKKRREEAEAGVVKELSGTLSHWFGLTKDQFNGWHTSAEAPPPGKTEVVLEKEIEDHISPEQDDLFSELEDLLAEP